MANWIDLHRLTITPDYVIRVDPQLDEPYDLLDGVGLDVPTTESDRPLVQQLANHNAECDWL